MNGDWSPWNVISSLPPHQRRAEAIRQQVALHDLLATSLPQGVRVILRQFEESIAAELSAESSNKGEKIEERKNQQVAC